MLLLHAITLGLSATLLFLVQPMFAKMVLPMLGGSPQVWNTCCVFFQALLLLGYGYAHLSTRLLGPRLQALLHLPLLAAPLLVLPISIPAGWDPTKAENPGLWLTGLLTATVALPFLVTSANAPMLQKWFSASGHPAARDPYFLYGASNLGSMGALLAYPLLVEPALALPDQSALWTRGYALLALLVAICAITLLKAPASAGGAGDSNAIPEATPPTARDRLAWLALSLVPSSLLLGVTTHLTTNLAPVPLLWVVPLVLYLATFIVTFAPWAPSTAFLCQIHAFLAIPLVIIFHIPGPPWMMILHLVTFTTCVLLCHRRLAELRPDPAHLTGFYLWMSLGGVLGGLFNTLCAPVLFDNVTEYPLMFVAACALRLPGKGTRSPPGAFSGLARDAFHALVLLGMVLAFLAEGRTLELGEAWGPFVLTVLGIGGLAAYSARHRPARFACAIAAMLVASGAGTLPALRTLHEGRSFFGVHRVVTEPDGAFHLLFHGNTLHGAEKWNAQDEKIPLTYYHPTGPAGDVLGSARARTPGLDVGLVGLGTGALVTYGTAGQDYTFFEIDPLVIEIASNPDWFRYLSTAACDVRLVPGDARLTLTREPMAAFDVLVIDAFSSDSIPMHLLTKEALSLYLERLKARGVLLLHISNRYLDLEPAVAELAAALGLKSRVRRDPCLEPELKEMKKSPSHWVAMTRQEEDLDVWNTGTGRWEALRRRPGLKPWTDSFSNIMSVLGRE